MISRLSTRYRGVATFVAVALFALLAGCTPEHSQSIFDTSGLVAESQLLLFYWIFWAAVFVFVTVVGAAPLYGCSVLHAARRRRLSSDPRPHPP